MPETRENLAAFLTAPRKSPLEIQPVAYTSPAENEIVVRNHAISINHIDWKIQDHEFVPFRYPGVLGHESAGEVVEVGSGVQRFRVGDRVLAEGTSMGSGRDADGSFQLYTVVADHVAAPIPDSLSFEQAAVLPLGISTAIMGLYAEGTLELQYPSLNARPVGEVVLVWGGAGSVGSNAIQLAAHAGYEVITTASPHNFDHVRKLGATAVFDYNQPSIIDDLVAALKGKKLAGAFDAIGVASSTTSLAKVVVQSQGKRALVSVLPPPAELPEGVAFKMAWAVVSPRELGLAIYENFLPQALADGKYLAAPEPLVVGKGLEYIQHGMDLLSKGVSAKKIVVSL